MAETLDEHTFQAMTDGEFYALLALIRQACEREARRERVRKSALDRILRRLFAR